MCQNLLAFPSLPLNGMTSYKNPYDQPERMIIEEFPWLLAALLLFFQIDKANKHNHPENPTKYDIIIMPNLHNQPSDPSRPNWQRDFILEYRWQ